MSSSRRTNNSVPNINLYNNSNEITIDCENYNRNGNNGRVNNGSNPMSPSVDISHARNQSAQSLNNNSSSTHALSHARNHSASAHTLFESSQDTNSYRVVRSYREYAAEFMSDSDNMDESNSEITGSDTSINDTDFLRTKKNTFDIYRNKSGSSLKNYGIEKSKTVKSTSTVSTNRTAYKNPTLSSVVNQANTSFDKSYFDQQYDDLKKNHKIDTQLKLQKMILNVPETYDIPTRDKKIISQRILNITLVIMIIIASTLLSLFIYLKVNHGYSLPHIKDINDQNRTIIIFVSLFMYLTVALGALGSALNWKSILVTYCICCLLNAGALGVLVYGVYDDAYKFSNLPVSWWDVYSSNTRKVIQDKFTCCGFKEPLDGGEISNACTKEAVVWNLPYELLYDNFKLERKDNCNANFNVTIMNVKNKNKDKNDTDIPTPIMQQVPLPTPVEEANSTTATSEAAASTSSPSSSSSTSSTSSSSSSSPSPSSSSSSSSSSSTSHSPSTSTSKSISSQASKRSFDIGNEGEMEIISYSRNIYNILRPEEIEEVNDARDDQLLSTIRVLNKRNGNSIILESKDEYQSRVNATINGIQNPDINWERVTYTNYTRLTPEESRSYANLNGIKGCEAKLHEYIHKNVTPVFYVLLMFFCLYIITIPVALIFLFKLRTIKTVNEFD